MKLQFISNKPLYFFERFDLKSPEAQLSQVWMHFQNAECAGHPSARSQISYRSTSSPISQSWTEIKWEISRMWFGQLCGNWNIEFKGEIFAICLWMGQSDNHPQRRHVILCEELNVANLSIMQWLQICTLHFTFCLCIMRAGYIRHLSFLHGSPHL